MNRTRADADPARTKGVLEPVDFRKGIDYRVGACVSPKNKHGKERILYVHFLECGTPAALMNKTVRADPNVI